ncbi:VanZ family protein [Sporofaciens musculi]|jgi:VanZ family protein|uniref:VanZ family protein n=1 Tax=Sporofaciens musculi TaxID=2681861 RepID=UPI002F40DD85
MRKLLLYILKPFSFLPALLMMYVIYSFSAQTADVSGSLSYAVSYKIVEIGNDVLETGFTDEQIGRYAHRIEHPVRKLAHMTEYFLLAVAVSFPFYVYGVRGFALMLVAGLICVGFAAGDEYHQSFVAGRGPSKKDVMIDSIGAFFGIVCVRIICWTAMTPFRVAKRIEERAQRKARAKELARERARDRERTTRARERETFPRERTRDRERTALSRERETFPRERTRDRERTALSREQGTRRAR